MWLFRGAQEPTTEAAARIDDPAANGLVGSLASDLRVVSKPSKADHRPSAHKQSAARGGGGGGGDVRAADAAATTEAGEEAAEDISHEDLLLKVGEQGRKLVAASRTVHRMRAQVKSLRAQQGLKDLHISKLHSQVTQLQGLLVNKEQRLQETLESLTRSRAEQEPKLQSVMMLPSASASTLGGKEQIASLVLMTEQLTKALEEAHGSETSIKQRFAALGTELRLEKNLRVEQDQELRALEAEKVDLEDRVAELQRTVRERDHAISLDRAQITDLRERFARAQVEECLQKRLGNASGAQKTWHPHLDV